MPEQTPEQLEQEQQTQQIAQPPQGQEQPPENPNPYDITQDLSSLEELQAELEQSTSAIDSDFATYFAENMPESLEELFFEDRASFLLEVEKAKQQYIQEKITPLQTKGQELMSNIENKEKQGSIWQAQLEFKKANPKADLDDILRFYSEELSPKQKEGLKDLSPLELYTKVYEMMQGTQDSKQSPQQEQEKQKLPKDTSDAQFETDSLNEDNLYIGNDRELPINRR